MSRLSRLLPLLLAMLASTILAFSAHAPAQMEGALNKILAPGPLSKPHENLEEKDCLKCHGAGKGVPDGKCLSCHSEIQYYVDLKRGFHGLNEQSCTECHSEHKGRDFDMMAFDPNGFEHLAKTGYALEGKHAQLKCTQCHTGRRPETSARPGEIRYFGKAATCVSCHSKDDIHHFPKNQTKVVGGKAAGGIDFGKKDCNACHTTQSWKTGINFEHSRDTHFKLEGAHAQLKCNDCHSVDKKGKIFKYRWPNLEQQKCLACHADEHKTNLSRKFRGGQCLTCHEQTQKTWKIEKFDHLITHYPLKGKHAELTCVECHKQTPALAKQPSQRFFRWTGLKSQCLSCHKDVHLFGGFKSRRFRNPNGCVSCHTESSWKAPITFDHNINTRYVLDGAHEDVECEQCHIVNKKKPYGVYFFPKLEEKTCENCHKNPHVGSFKAAVAKQKCTSCHITESWTLFKNGKGLDHTKTRFPLTGAHLAARCADCHGEGKKQVYKFKSFAAKFCIDCHVNVHLGQTGKPAQFSKNFANKNCTECHSTQNFKTRLPFDHNQTQFKLIGAHTKVSCVDCHTVTGQMMSLNWPNQRSKREPAFLNVGKYQFPGLKSTGCTTCHQDAHAGELGSQCTQCHNETAWKPVQFDHNKQSRFHLQNKHASLKCSECHKPTEKTFNENGVMKPVVHFKPMGVRCIDCHQDYHAGQLGQRCDQCHSDKGWKPVQFDHNQSRFPLKFKHQDVSCAKCHKPTDQTVVFKNVTHRVERFKPLSTQCVDCHKDPHKGTRGNKCQDCHTEKGWNQVQNFHKNFTLTGVHYTLACTECHKDGRNLSGLSQQCFTCHQKDDIHHGTLPNCQDCHTQHFWEISNFKHSLTTFPLLGVHRTLDCMACHNQGIYQGLSTQCVSCHLSDYNANPRPEHIGNLDCVECHRNNFTFGGSL